MYITGNPVPSDKIEDLSDNGKVFDTLVTQTEGTTTDRLGRTRRVFQQILMDMGFQPLSGSFQSGATITARNQCLQDTSTGTFYSWSGVISESCYVVPAGSTPATSGGIGVNAWVDRTDVVLRSDLATTTGAGLVGTTDGITVQAKLNAIAADKANTSDLATKADTTALLNRTASLYVNASVSGGVMTWTLPKQTLRFRNPTLTNGAPVEVTPTSDLTLTFPVGSSCGTRSGILENLIPVVLYNGGNPVLGAQNLSGRVDLSEAGLLSATAISASAKSDSVTYASTAVTSSPYIVAGLVQSTQATAGTWETAPSVTPKSTNLAAMIGGVGFYPPVDVTASRTFSTTYYNTTPRPNKVKVVATQVSTNGFIINLTVNGVIVDSNGFGGSATSVTRYFSVEWIVPPGGSYLVSWENTKPTIAVWVEA